MNKGLLIAILFACANVHADPQLTDSELTAKTLNVCDSLASAIEDTDRLELNAQVRGDAATQSTFQTLDNDLVKHYSALDCRSKIEERNRVAAENARVRAEAATALDKQCRDIQARFGRAQDVLDDAALAGLDNSAKSLGNALLEGQPLTQKLNANGKKINARFTNAANQLDSLRAEYKRLGCISRRAKN